LKSQAEETFYLYHIIIELLIIHVSVP